MSRTVRRTHFNKKSRFFKHYWETYSQKEVDSQKYIERWKYHSDNYYTKSAKNRKQAYIKVRYGQMRQEFNLKSKMLFNLDRHDENFDIVMEKHWLYNIKYDIH